MSPPRKILFVCTGNTCRSPMAAALFRKALGELPGGCPSHVKVRSAGTSANPRDPATDLALEVMKGYGLDLRSHQASPVTRGLIEWADLILTMKKEHKTKILSLVPEAKSSTFTLGEYVGTGEEIKDPLIESTEMAYERCANQLWAAVSVLAKKLNGEGGHQS